MAASGMCDAGRIRRRLKRWLWSADATVLLTGFQVQGTLGRLLADGAKRVSIQGEDIRVAARIRSLDVYSGHADAGGLVSWALARRPIAGKVFLCHGEPQASAGLARRLAAAGLAVESLVRPELDEAFRLTGVAVEPTPAPKPRLAAGAPSALDWHNARVELLGDLDAALESAPDDAARERLLQNVRGTLARGLSPLDT
jgi:metallo-beta-lactamase family protein